MSEMHMFGGDWTEEKLEMLRKYLYAYAEILKDKPFTFGYIDAFAGSGYWSKGENSKEYDDKLLFPSFDDEPAQKFIHGSARVALELELDFDGYVFIEENKDAVKELENLKVEYPSRADRIMIEQGDANEWLQGRARMNWRKHRAVVFLDPYGMQVEWSTIEALASTKAVDLWILFPLGIAVNRLLTKNKDFPPGWKSRLNTIFGTNEWEDKFYEDSPTLMGDTESQKIVSLEGIGRYYNDRLASIFEKVAPNPRPLYNSTGNPLYLLCFAAANPRGADTAVKIAQHILQP